MSLDLDYDGNISFKKILLKKSKYFAIYYK